MPLTPAVRNGPNDGGSAVPFEAESTLLPPRGSGHFHSIILSGNRVITPCPPPILPRLLATKFEKIHLI